jgi:hypothetical protein
LFPLFTGFVIAQFVFGGETAANGLVLVAMIMMVIFLPLFIATQRLRGAAAPQMDLQLVNPMASEAAHFQELVATGRIFNVHDDVFRALTKAVAEAGLTLDLHQFLRDKLCELKALGSHFAIVADPLIGAKTRAEAITQIVQRLMTVLRDDQDMAEASARAVLDANTRYTGE